MSQPGPHYSSHSTAKINDISTSSERMVSSGISDVVIASVCYVKTCLKKLMMMMKAIIIMNKSRFLAVTRN